MSLELTASYQGAVAGWLLWGAGAEVELGVPKAFRGGTPVKRKEGEVGLARGSHPTMMLA